MAVSIDSIFILHPKEFCRNVCLFWKKKDLFFFAVSPLDPFLMVSLSFKNKLSGTMCALFVNKPGQFTPNKRSCIHGCFAKKFPRNPTLSFVNFIVQTNKKQRLRRKLYKFEYFVRTFIRLSHGHVVSEHEALIFSY